MMTLRHTPAPHLHPLYPPTHTITPHLHTPHTSHPRPATPTSSPASPPLNPAHAPTSTTCLPFTTHPTLPPPVSHTPRTEAAVHSLRSASWRQRWMRVRRGNMGCGTTWRLRRHGRLQLHRELHGVEEGAMGIARSMGCRNRHLEAEA